MNNSVDCSTRNKTGNPSRFMARIATHHSTSCVTTEFRARINFIDILTPCSCYLPDLFWNTLYHISNTGTTFAESEIIFLRRILKNVTHYLPSSILYHKMNSFQCHQENIFTLYSGGRDKVAEEGWDQLCRRKCLQVDSNNGCTCTENSRRKPLPECSRRRNLLEFGPHSDVEPDH